MIYVFLTILLTVYGQLIIKWQVSHVGITVDATSAKIIFLVQLLSNIWVLSGLFAAFAAGLSWMLAISKMQLSYAYPFTSLTFALVLIFSSILFYEPISWQKIVGLMFVMLGVCISSYG